MKKTAGSALGHPPWELAAHGLPAGCQQGDGPTASTKSGIIARMSGHAVAPTDASALAGSGRRIYYALSMFGSTLVAGVPPVAMAWWRVHTCRRQWAGAGAIMLIFRYHTSRAAAEQCPCAVAEVRRGRLVFCWSWYLRMYISVPHLPCRMCLALLQGVVVLVLRTSFPRCGYAYKLRSPSPRKIMDIGH